jgi:cathepsin L
VLVALFAAAVAIPMTKIRGVTSSEEALFQKFKTDFNKSYIDAPEESYRQAVFLANLQYIENHNDGKHTYKLAMNKFGDLTLDEFSAKYTGFGGARAAYARSQNIDMTAARREGTIADAVDWTTVGAVTPVKDQGQCGSCWSFSATGSLEGAWFLAKGDLISLSEQQLMDCSKDEGNYSCEGGWMDSAFEYVIKNNGICSEAEYPYQMKDRSTCDPCTNVANITTYRDIPQSENALKTAVSVTPVSVAIEADQSDFQFYESGVMTGECGTNLDHGVLTVGYGVLDGIDYWKVKNSWGPDWGDEGYILIERNKEQEGGQCGIHLAASYPIV